MPMELVYPMIIHSPFQLCLANEKFQAWAKIELVVLGWGPDPRRDAPKIGIREPRLS